MTTHPHLPPVQAPAGYYAVPNPTRPAVLTAWRVDARGRLHRHPSSTRWEPPLPDLDGLRGDERRAAQDAYYTLVCFPWKRRIVEAIDANPIGARVAFARRYPEVFVAQARRAREDAARQRRRGGEEITAALMAARGTSVNRIARDLGISWDTARDRIAAGQAAWIADPVAARAALLERYRPALAGSAVDPEAFVDRLIAPLVAHLRAMGADR